jgi:SAM-dependent methyltransferase
MNKKKYEVVKDPKYGYLRAEPIPTEEEVNKYYLEEFYAQNKEKFNNSSLETQIDQSDFFKSKYENYFSNCENIIGSLKDKSVYDIGFGFAQALLFFKNKKMKVSGIEPSKEGYEFAKKNGLDVNQGSIESTFIDVKQKFDLVTLLNVLEHLRNPAEVLVNIREKLLAKNGLLLIDVPNDFNDFQTVANQEYDLNQWWFFPPRHINYFSRSSLSSLLEQCGYEVMYAEGSFPLELFLLFGDVYVNDGELGRKCHDKRVQFENLLRKHNKHEKLSAFYKSLADLELGRDIVIYAKPKQ